MIERGGGGGLTWESRLGLLVRGVGVSCFIASLAGAADVGDAEALFRKGEYEACAGLAEEGLKGGFDGERWRLLHIRAEMARGEYESAMESAEEALDRYGWSIPARMLAFDVFRRNGRADEAVSALGEIERLVRSMPARFAGPEQRVALGRYFLLHGADAKQVLERFYDVATQGAPDLVEAHLAKAELALEKGDDALAADTLRQAPESARVDPSYHYLMAQAYSDGDRAASEKSLEQALAINPNHVPSRLLRADHRIDAERYDEAAEEVERALGVDSREPRAWAFRAILAHLEGDEAGEADARGRALATWSSNPEVDHVIGCELSQKYRFAEGAAAQRRALAIDPASLPAKLELCQDLLRLGEEEEGWRLADEVHARDAYNVVAFNLVQLRDHLAGFRTLTAEGLIVRMDPREADLYGQRVLELLSQARETLCERYGATLTDEVVVEIFPRKKDFAVRTFGLPGGDGLLGVCFGQVITANSPASQGESPANWEAVLWHEMCHSVTLAKTHNKMPRWLSEGISVYEEGTQDASWSMAVLPPFRERLMSDELTPLSRLSSAFLAPKTSMDLQFAYFESSLAVRFLIETFGMPALTGLLEDLGSGRQVEESLAMRTGMTREELDVAFAGFAQGYASRSAPLATWERPEASSTATLDGLTDWVDSHPNSVPGLQKLSSRLVAEERWEEAGGIIERFRSLDPDYGGPENAYELSASVCRGLGNVEEERAALEGWSARDAGAGAAFLRLMELAEAAGEWETVALQARRMLAVNPLIAAPHRGAARAAERLGRGDEAIAAYRALAILDPTDPAELHYRLAKLLHQAGRESEAKREVLRSLEEAPRFLDAHRLLREIASTETKDDSP